ncbi:hypothetical protein GIB67_023626 [Kingdonia uniflora]|uniref:Uncharacterized protein n=1 Tax=Kingdonia uniflora TaxID=39325 RepID=A0A7J7L543_9MAGN|nr:hypothetical protein GIB67_023626 [Kingdonia uniflora]
MLAGVITYGIILNGLYNKCELFSEGKEIWSRMEMGGVATDIQCYTIDIVHENIWV